MNLLQNLIREAINEAVDKLETINKNARYIEEVEELASKLNDALSVEFDPAVVVYSHVGKVGGFLRSRDVTASQLKEIFVGAGVLFKAQKTTWANSETIEFYIENYAPPVRIFLGVNEFSLAS